MRVHRRYWLLVPLLCLLVWFALWYAQQREVPRAVALALLPAFLLELALYFATASERLRNALGRLSKGAAAGLLTAAAVPSYLLYAVPSGVFEFTSGLAIAAMAAIASFWYVLLGKRAAADAGFLALMAAPVLFRIFEEIYANPAPRIPMQTVGVIMWYRTGIVAVLVLRGIEGVGFGLLPRRLDWAIGVRNFLFFLPLGLLTAYALEFIRPSMPDFTPRLLANAVLYFIGTLWFLAVAEEFFFRGLLQQLLARLLRSDAAGLLMASVLFGAAHLGFRSFPNWRFALLAAIAGVFYGRAFLQAASIRAAMVTHALVVTLWRVFLA